MSGRNAAPRVAAFVSLALVLSLFLPFLVSAQTADLPAAAVTQSAPNPPRASNPPGSWDWPIASDVPSSVVLRWEGGDPDPGDVVRYTVYLGIQSAVAPAPVAGCVGITSTTCDPPGSLQPNKTYSWYVVAKDNHGNRTESFPFRFHTAGACPSGQVQASYHNNKTLDGVPVLTRCEPATGQEMLPIDHNWGDGAPAPGVSSDNFSVTWTGTYLFYSDALYLFSATADDGIQVWVDDTLVIDAWKDQAATTYLGSVYLKQGFHRVFVKYYESLGKAVARVSWGREDLGGCLTGQFFTQYFSGKDLSTVAISDCERNLPSHDWGTGGPGDLVDNFSARWVGVVYFEAGGYTFYTTVDDGARLYVDGKLLIDQWKVQAPTTYSVPVTLAAGYHEVKLEYYENTGGAVAKLAWHRYVCPVGQYLAQYFNNPTLSGTGPTLARCEADPLSHDWGTGKPSASINADAFSARFSGTFYFPGEGYHAFTATTDDGMRVWVDGSLIIDQWKQQPPTTYVASKWLGAGLHSVRVEYFEATGGALAKLSWSLDCGQGYKAEYFNNRTLSGKPVLVRCEGTTSLNHNWYDGSPENGVNVDNFSVRWTGRIYFGDSDAGPYNFYATTDDGMRVWVDGAQIVNSWKEQSPTTYSATKTLPAGVRYWDVKVEYFEATGGAVASFIWTKGCKVGEFRAQYYNNKTLSGSPVLTGCEATINHAWGAGSPAPGVVADSFSARYTGTLWLEGVTGEWYDGTLFTVTSDDGFRLSVSGTAGFTLEAWKSQAPTSYSIAREYTSAEYRVVTLEYFENTGGAVVKLDLEEMSDMR